MNRHTFECLQRLEAAGIRSDDALALRRIAMTLHRWHELECGNSNDYKSWAIERDGDEPDSTPYMVDHCHETGSFGWEVWCREDVKPDGEKGDYVRAGKRRTFWSRETADEYAKTINHSREPIIKPILSRRTRIADRENGAKKRLAAIMKRYPTLQTYIQGDPRGAALYILRPGDVPEGATVDSCYSRGVAVYK